MMKDRFQTLKEKILEFRQARDWEQFHDPKNLAEAISIEAGELLANFLWKDVEGGRRLSESELGNAREEAADILIFLTYLSEELGFDLMEAAFDKVKKNGEKYPVDKSKGSSRKYTEL